MAPWGIIIRAFLILEDAIVSRILQSPRFHHAVRRIHRTVEDIRHGRDPNEPLRPGEATEDPNAVNKGGSFLGHFVEELRTQFKGRPPKPPQSSVSPPKK